MARKCFHRISLKPERCEKVFKLDMKDVCSNRLLLCSLVISFLQAERSRAIVFTALGIFCTLSFLFCVLKEEIS